MLTHLSDLPEGASILNIGSGGDVELMVKNALQAKKITLHSMDIDPERRPDIVADVCSMPFQDGQYDVVLLMEVLEHVKEPFVAIDEIYRVLKAKGKLIMSTPFIYAIHANPHDYYRYTKHGLAYILRRFSVTTIKERNSYVESINVLLIRSSSDSDERARWVSFFLFYSGFCFFIKLIGSRIRSTNLTTGYVAIALK